MRGICSAGRTLGASSAGLIGRSELSLAGKGVAFGPSARLSRRLVVGHGLSRGRNCCRDS